MSSRRSDDNVKLPVALTGLNLAISVAREAADAVPVVKQTLGAAVRILALAEKIDKDREALHALADRSFQLAQRVKDVMDGRVPDEKILSTLDRINRAFDSIEAFMRKHTRRTRLLRVIGYVFTVPLHVERLSRELDDAVQALVLVALLDINHEAHAMHGLVAESARYVGEFRLLRHCEVEKLKPVEINSLRNIGAKYHRARVDGQLAVVQYFEETEDYNSPVVKSMVTAHGRIVEELSTVQRSHRNVARIYGWSRGSSLDRFTVFKSGYLPVGSVLCELPDPMTSMIRWACKDAADHLRRLGISWFPRDPPYMLDEHLEPTIGLQIDMLEEYWLGVLYETRYHVGWAVDPIENWLPALEVEATDVQAAVANCPHLLSRLVKVRRRSLISKADITPWFALSDGTAERLPTLLAEAESASNMLIRERIWADILLALDKNRSHTLQTGLRVSYTTESRVHGRDRLDLHGLAEDSEHIVYDWYSVEIPVVHRDEVRRMLGISTHCPGEHATGKHIIKGGPSTYRVSK